MTSPREHAAPPNHDGIRVGGTSVGTRAVHALLALMVCADIVIGVWFSAVKPDRSRGPDEQYSLRNVEHTLRSGELTPINPYYPGLSQLPQTLILAVSQLIYRQTGNEVFSILQPVIGVTVTGYRLCRLMVVLYGAGYLLLTFVIGRRLFSPATALLGVLICMTAPVHIRATTIYKPDALLVLFVLATFLWSLDAAEKGTLRSYAVAGAGVGLAAASKQTGALAALPLVLATVLRWRNRWRWLWLCVAGAVSVGTFFVFNPWLDRYPKLFAILRPYFGWTGQRRHGTERGHHLSAVLFVPRKIVGWAFHGPVLGALSLLGFAALLVLVLRRREERSRAVPVAMFVLFPTGFALICAAINDFHRQNVFLSLLPFTSLAAAWSLVQLWSFTGARLEMPWRRLLFWPALTFLLTVVLWRAGVFVYQWVA